LLTLLCVINTESTDAVRLLSTYYGSKKKMSSRYKNESCHKNEFTLHVYSFYYVHMLICVIDIQVIDAVSLFLQILALYYVYYVYSRRLLCLLTLRDKCAGH